MVEADGGRVTLACCVRRDVLRQRRRTAPGAAVGVIIEQYLRDSCQAVRAALRHAQRESPWQSAGPLRPGFHEAPSSDLVRIGNAAVEAHPLIGEGICMALQSAAHLAHLLGAPPRALDRGYIREVQRAHVKICRADFSARVRVARIYAAIAMRPSLSAQAGLLLHSWPGLLTLAAQLAGKARGAMAYPEK
jgi:2-polyprenyl-6-methoxyphenol hydroxylase-like FAD-dependent oxidoreductase